MTGASPVANLFAPFTQGLAGPSTTAGFSCLGVNVMGIGIPPKIHNCGCTGTNCTCQQDELTSYANLPQNIAGQTYCGYAGVTSAPIVNDANPKTIKLSVPSGPKRIIEVVGIVDSVSSPVCNLTGPIGDNQDNGTDKPNYFEVGRAVVDLFNSRTVPVPDTWTDLASNPTEQAKHQINCGGNTPSSYIAYIPTEAGLLAYWPMIESSGSTQTIVVGSGIFSSMTDANGAAAGAIGPLLQSLDSSSNFALTLSSGISKASGTVSTATTFAGALTIEAWVQIPSGAPCSPFGKIFEMGATVPQIRLHCLTSGNEAAFQVFDGTGSAFIDSTVPLNDGLWHHVVGVYVPGSGSNVFVDGINRSTGPVGTSVTSMTFNAADIFGVSGSTNGLPSGSKVAHVAIYTTALSSQAILQHFKASGR